jgi:hypothetical protein
MLIKMDRRKFINASALSGAGRCGPYLGENSGNDRPGNINSDQDSPGKTICSYKTDPAGSGNRYCRYRGGPAGSAATRARSGVNVKHRRFGGPGSCNSGHVRNGSGLLILSHRMIEGLRKGWLFDA